MWLGTPLPADGSGAGGAGLAFRTASCEESAEIRAACEASVAWAVYLEDYDSRRKRGRCSVCLPASSFFFFGRSGRRTPEKTKKSANERKD